MPKGNGQPNGEGWWTDTRKLFLTQILTVLLTPASVVVTLLVTDSYKAPQARLEYVSAAARYDKVEPSRALAGDITREPLSWQFRGTLHASNTSESSEDCIYWLDGGDWDSNCGTIYKSAAIETKGMMKSMLDQIKGRSSRNILPAPAKPEQLSSLIRAMDQLLKELAELDSKPRSRSGEVEITVGVMNVGGSDGLIFDRATVRFDGGEFNTYTEKYTPVGAHSFAPVAFTTAYEKDGSIQGSWDTDQKPAIKKWSDLVKTGKEVPFELVVTMSDKTVSIKSSVPQENGG